MDKSAFKKMCMAFVFFIIHDCDSSILTPLYNPGIFEVVERGIKWFKVPHIHPAYITPFNPCSTVGHLAAQYLEISDFTRLPLNLRCAFVDAMQQLSLLSDTMMPQINAQERCHKLLQIFAEHPSTIKYSTASYDQSAQQHHHSAASSNSHKTAHINDDGTIRTNEHAVHPDAHSIICDDAANRLKHLDNEYKGLRGMHISNDPSVISNPIQKAVDSTIDVIRKSVQCGTFKNMFPSRHNNDNGNTVHHRHGNRIHRPVEDIHDRTALQNSVAEYDVLGEGNLPLRRRGRLRGRILQPVIIEPVIISDTKTSVLPGGEESFVNPLRVRSLM